MTRKLVLVAVVLLLAAGVPAAAATLKVGATPVPHAEILEQAVAILSAQGITLEIVEFTDYVRPNLALEEGDLDANFFQHVPYLEAFNQDAGTNLVSLAGIHVEPLGVFSQKISSLEELPARASIAIPNDATNGGRALLLLQAAGLITVDILLPDVDGLHILRQLRWGHNPGGNVRDGPDCIKFKVNVVSMARHRCAFVSVARGTSPGGTH